MKCISWILGVAALMIVVLFSFQGVQRAVAAGPQAAAPGVEVKIDNFSFTPATLTVTAGTQITWTNHDDIPHTVVSADNAFKSRALDTDEKFTFTPSKPGTYSYFCSLHPKMMAKVVVE